MSLLDLILGGAQAPAQAQAQVQPTPPIESPITVQGDNWHPSSPGWLGKALDTVLMLKGKHPVFQERKAQEDLNKIMPDFNSDPEQTIKRIAKIPGYADDAYKMKEQYDTDQERNQSRDIRDASKKDLIFTRLGGMAGATNEKNFDHMHQFMVDYVKRWGENPDDYHIPSTYDKDALDAMSGGAITSKDQQSQLLQAQGLALRSQAAGNLASYRQERLAQLQLAEEDRQSRAAAARQAQQDRFDKLHPTPKVVDTPQGKMELSPSGTTGRIGEQIWSKVQTGQWKRIK